eukprot:10314144-Ditylum_brightwellii.AAC.1
MVLTNAQTTAFFKDDDQMAIPHNTVVHLVNEGISTVNDLEEFQKMDIEQIAGDLRRPRAKSVKRMTAACKLVQYYTT